MAAYQESGDRAGIAAGLRQLGNIAFQQKDYGRAVTLLSAAHSAAMEIQSPDSPAISAELQAAQKAAGNSRFHYHYATAREMYNLVKAAEAGWRGAVAEALDYLVVSNLQERDASVTAIAHARPLAPILEKR